MKPSISCKQIGGGHHAETRAINPTEWLQHFQLSHAIEVTGGERVLYLSGETSTVADGTTLHKGDIVAQFAKAWQNLKDALTAANMTPSNIVRLNLYTTDVAAFMKKAEEIVPIWAAEGIRPAAALLGFTGLFDHDLMVEIEATAVA